VKCAVASLLLATALASAPGAAARERGGAPVALVTAEADDELLAVALPSGKVVHRLRLPDDPENVDVRPTGPAVVVSTKAGAVTILAWQSLRVLRTLHGFREPHIAAISPSGAWAYVTDDATGLLSVIRLRDARLVRRVPVGLGAHHLSWSPDGGRVWIALGEKAQTIVVLDSSHPDRPRVVARFEPGFAAHDLGFAPDGRSVWVTADDGEDVAAFDAQSRKRLFAVPVGPPPQHVAFGAHGVAYLTSGYGSRIVMASASGRVLGSAATPYGSFNLTVAGGLVVTSSLLGGTVTELTDRLRLVRTVHVASEARDVGVSVW
jgi:DNA-binding beta-propeller fold protein YncE